MKQRIHPLKLQFQSDYSDHFQILSWLRLLRHDRCLVCTIINILISSCDTRCIIKIWIPFIRSFPALLCNMVTLIWRQVTCYCFCLSLWVRSDVDALMRPAQELSSGSVNRTSSVCLGRSWVWPAYSRLPGEGSERAALQEGLRGNRSHNGQDGEWLPAVIIAVSEGGEWHVLSGHMLGAHRRTLNHASVIHNLLGHKNRA